MEEKIKKKIKELGTSKYKKGISWNGYEVYEPLYDKMAYIGEPIVVLVKGDQIRFSNTDESYEYLKYEQENA